LNVIRTYPEPLFASNAAGLPFSRFGARQRLAIQEIDLLPRLFPSAPLQYAQNRWPRRHVQVYLYGSRVKGLVVFGPDLKAAAGEGEPMADDVTGCLTVALGLSCNPGALQVHARLLGRLREGREHEARLLRRRFPDARRIARACGSS
jgi:hypothetical protein